MRASSPAALRARGRSLVALPARILPLLPGSAAIAWCLIAESHDRGDLFAKQTQEDLSLIVTPITIVIAGVLWSWRRTTFAGLLFAAAVVIMLREIHWDWTTKFVYIAIAGLGVYAWIVRDRLLPELQRRPIARTWAIATAATYLLSQLVARRLPQHFFGEESTIGQLLELRWYGIRFYGHIEEVIELTAHGMMFITVVLSGLLPPAAIKSGSTPADQGDGDEDEEDSSGPESAQLD